jgi:hypothetical protein
MLNRGQLARLTEFQSPYSEAKTFRLKSVPSNHSIAVDNRFEKVLDLRGEP